MDIVSFLLALNTRIPGITVANALGLVEDAQRYLSTTERPIRFLYDLSTLDGRVAYTRSLPDVMQYVTDEYATTKKIQGIKALRAAMADVAPEWSGLKECKDVMDVLCPVPLYR